MWGGLIVCNAARLCENVGDNFDCKHKRKIDLIEQPLRDDRMLGNGFITPDFSALVPLFEFSHSLQRKRVLANGIFLEAQF
jgi:hypothetical protein